MSTQHPRASRRLGFTFIIGAGIGVVFGVVFDNIALGVSLGAGIGLLAGILIERSAGKSENTQSQKGTSS